MVSSEQLIIKIDSRERQFWSFEGSEHVESVIVGKLDTGDYSIVGMESLFTIERKKSVSEFAQNSTQDRFKRELERLGKYQHKFIVCEFDYQALMDWPNHAGIPPNLSLTQLLDRIYIEGYTYAFKDKFRKLGYYFDFESKKWYANRDKYIEVLQTITALNNEGLRKIKVSSNFLVSFVSMIQVDYGVPVLFCGDRENSIKCAISIMRRVNDRKKC